MQHILISGGSGFIAQNFYNHFANKYRFTLLSHTRQPQHITMQDLENNIGLIKSIDVVINLAGANISTRLWSDKRKNELLDSRINTTNNLVAIFNQHNQHAHFISASAIGIYPTDTLSNENTLIDFENYANFSQQLTKQWECSAKNYTGKLTITRFGVVLSAKGGAFPQLLRPFLFGIGGHLGNGSQYFSWIALIDLLNALDLIITKQLAGTYNLVAPQSITNHELSQLIATIWRRPNWLHLPTKIITLLFGQMGQELFLNSIQVLPNKLFEQNFTFICPAIGDCLLAIKHHEF